MTSQTYILRQGHGVTRDEWRLQWRSWGTWLVGLFYSAVVISEHPVFGVDGSAISLSETAAIWADRTVVVGSLVAVLTIPFALDRVRRQHVAPIEFSKPFARLAYVIGKLVGAALPLMVVTALSMVIHAAITLATNEVSDVSRSVSVYIGQAILIALPPLIFATAVTYCLSVYIRRPIIIIPVYLGYMMSTAYLHIATDLNFSWFSPLLRPDNFDYQIPDEMLPLVVTHQLIYLLVSVILVVLASSGFRRSRFLDTGRKTAVWSQIRIPALSIATVQLRLLWGGHIVAAILFALMALGNALSNTETNAWYRVSYTIFNLEFYLPLAGLFILTAVLAQDQRLRTLELILTKPVNRWRLLAKRLLPALMMYVIVVLLIVALLHITYQPLPATKAILASLATGIYLGCVGMTIANSTRNPLAGYGGHFSCLSYRASQLLT